MVESILPGSKDSGLGGSWRWNSSLMAGWFGMVWLRELEILRWKESEPRLLGKQPLRPPRTKSLQIATISKSPVRPWHKTEVWGPISDIVPLVYGEHTLIFCTKFRQWAAWEMCEYHYEAFLALLAFWVHCGKCVPCAKWFCQKYIFFLKSLRPNFGRIPFKIVL